MDGSFLYELISQARAFAPSPRLISCAILPILGEADWISVPDPTNSQAHTQRSGGQEVEVEDR